MFGCFKNKTKSWFINKAANPHKFELNFLNSLLLVLITVFNILQVSESRELWKPAFKNPGTFQGLFHSLPPGIDFHDLVDFYLGSQCYQNWSREKLIF